MLIRLRKTGLTDSFRRKMVLNIKIGKGILLKMG